MRPSFRSRYLAYAATFLLVSGTVTLLSCDDGPTGPRDDDPAVIAQGR